MKNLTGGNIYKTFIVFAIPLVLAGLLSQGYNLIDTIIAGKFLGQQGLSALGATTTFITFISCPFWGFDAGIGIFTARLFGAGEYGRMRKSIIANCVIIVLVIVILAALIIVFRGPLADFLKIDTKIRKEALLYLCVYMAGFTAIELAHAFVLIMNAMGSSSMPFAMSLISAVINIGGNMLSVTVLKLGVLGIALSTVISAAVVDAFYCIKLHKTFKRLGVNKQKVGFSKTDMAESVKYSIPTTVQQTIMYVSSLLISPLVNSIGAAATASYAVVLKIYDANAAIFQNSAKTLSNYAAQCVGAKKLEKINKGVRVAALQGVLFTLPAVLVCCVFAIPICGAFFPKEFNGEALKYSVLFCRVYLPFILLNLFNNLFHAFYRGIAKMGILISITAVGSVARLAASAVAIPLFGMQGVFIGFAVSWLAEFLVAVFVYLKFFSKTEMLEKRIKK